jgi:hypothetical protein
MGLNRRAGGQFNNCRDDRRDRLTDNLKLGDWSRQRGQCQKIAHHAMVGGRRLIAVADGLLAVVVCLVVTLMLAVVMAVAASRAVRMMLVHLAGLGIPATFVSPVGVPRRGECVGEQVARQHRPHRNLPKNGHFQYPNRENPPT